MSKFVYAKDGAISPFTFPDDFVCASNCGLIAMSLATGCTLTEATDWFRVREKHRANWRGGTYPRNYGPFLSLKGKWFIHTKYDKRERVRTVGDYTDWKGNDGRIHVVSVAQHILTVRNGWIADQSECAPINFHWCRNKRVLETWEILP